MLLLVFSSIALPNQSSLMILLVFSSIALPNQNKVDPRSVKK